MFNEIYGQEVTITRQNVVYYACSGKFDDQIYDLRKSLSEDLTKNYKYANLNVQVQIISDQIDKAIQSNDPKTTFDGIKLLSQLTGKLVNKTESLIDVTNKVDQEDVTD